MAYCAYDPEGMNRVMFTAAEEYAEMYATEPQNGRMSDFKASKRGYTTSYRYNCKGTEQHMCVMYEYEYQLE